jgi:hypothetical protein
MFYNERKQQIIVAGFLPKGKKVLIVQSKEMPNRVCKAEYYNIPAWTLPFGEEPKKYLESTFNDFFEIKTNAVKILNTISYLQDEGAYHTVLITYMMNPEKNRCASLENCKNVHFMEKKDIDSYILSDKIKQIILDGFDLLD